MYLECKVDTVLIDIEEEKELIGEFMSVSTETKRNWSSIRKFYILFLSHLHAISDQGRCAVWFSLVA